MDMQEQDDLWDIEKRSGLFAYVRRKIEQQVRSEGRVEGRDEGRIEGRDEGRAEGRDEGRRVTLIEMILALLEVRGLEIDEASAAKVRACDELGSLEHWARRAREVQTVSELFASDDG
jgi:predicted transposase YdaD